MSWSNEKSPWKARRIMHVLSTFALIFALSACAERADDEGFGLDTTGVAEDTAGVFGDPGMTEMERVADTVSVTLTEFEIDMPTNLAAGPTVFEVTNEGTVEHNFEVEGAGLEESFITNLQPGDTRTLRVDLEAGNYRVYCPVEDHDDQGMTTDLMVDSQQPTAQR